MLVTTIHSVFYPQYPLCSCYNDRCAVGLCLSCSLLIDHHQPLSPHWPSSSLSSLWSSSSPPPSSSSSCFLYLRQWYLLHNTWNQIQLHTFQKELRKIYDPPTCSLYCLLYWSREGPQKCHHWSSPQKFLAGVSQFMERGGNNTRFQNLPLFRQAGGPYRIYSPLNLRFHSFWVE